MILVITLQASEAKKLLPKEELDRYVRICQEKRLELELDSFNNFDVL